MKRRIAILGSTGSIGTQTLDVVRQHPDLFEVVLLTANNSSDLLIQQAIEFDASNVVICNEALYGQVADALQNRDIKVFAGIDSACGLVAGDDIDIVVDRLVVRLGAASDAFDARQKAFEAAFEKRLADYEREFDKRQKEYVEFFTRRINELEKRAQESEARLAKVTDALRG